MVVWVAALLLVACVEGTAPRDADLLALVPCVQTGIDRHAECQVIRNLLSQAKSNALTKMTNMQLQQICSVCLPTVQHYLSINDLGVCNEFLAWTSTMQKQCANVTIVPVRCPDMTRPGCPELKAAGVEKWPGGRPLVAVNLATMKQYCDQCMPVMSVDLSSCPAERIFASALRTACSQISASHCFLTDYPQQMGPLTPCQPTIEGMAQYGGPSTAQFVTQTCGSCMPHLQDTLLSWRARSCAGQELSVLVLLKSMCSTGNSDTKCVADFLAGIPGCATLSSIAFGLNAFMTKEQCSACLARAATLISGSDRLACPSLVSQLDTLRTECLVGGFLNIRCTDLFHWLDTNHTYLPPPRNNSATMTLTLSLPTPTLTQTASAQAGATLAPAVPTPVPIPGPCADPVSCPCITVIKPWFLSRWRYYLPKCGLEVEGRAKGCVCGKVRDRLYVAEPACDGLFELPNFFTLCRDCAPRLPAVRPIIDEYDTCLGGTDGLSTLRGVRNICEPGGIGTGVCPNALMTAAQMPNCEGAFLAIITAGIRGEVLTTEDERDLMCANSTRCTSLILRNGPLTDELGTCGINVGVSHSVCNCWSLRQRFLEQAPSCGVLLRSEWKVSEVNFTRLCVKCRPAVAINGATLTEYGTCMGWGHYYTSDLAGNIDTVCSKRYLGPSGYGGNTPPNACQSPQNTCRATALCRVEDHLPACQLITQRANWRVDASNAEVCDTCVLPLLNAVTLAAAGTASLAERALSQAAAALSGCGPAWTPELLAVSCQHSANLCAAYPTACSEVAGVFEGCSMQVLEQAGQQWSLCLSAKSGQGQCECAHVFLQAMPPACANHSVVVTWLCVVREQGCPGVPYPPESVDAAECQRRMPQLGWSTRALQTKYAICAKATIDTFFLQVADKCVASGYVTNATCACIAEEVRALPMPCVWGETKEDIARVACLFRDECGLLAGTTNTDCAALHTAYARDLALVPLNERVLRSSACSAGLGRLAAVAAAVWERCAAAGGGCVCLQAVHRAMRLVRDCSDGSLEWEVLRCVAKEECGAWRGGGLTPPDRPTRCQALVAPGSAEHEVADLVPMGASLLNPPVCDHAAAAAAYRWFKECLAARPLTQEARCACVVGLSWQISLPCRLQPTAVWTHVRCLASDLGCTSIPMLRSEPCDRFYALRHEQPPFPAVSAAESTTTLVEDRVTNVPDACVQSTSSVDRLRRCHADRVAEQGGAPDPTGVPTNRIVCGCVQETYVAFEHCKEWQPAALENLLCLGEEWECYGLPPSRIQCAAAVTEVRSPHRAACVEVERVLRVPAVETCADLDRRRTVMPDACRTSGTTAAEYQHILCLSLARGCGAGDVPLLNCRSRFLADPLALQLNRRCRQTLTVLGRECAVLFDATTTGVQVEAACRGACGEAVRELQGALSASCSDADSWYARYLSSACTPNLNGRPVLDQLRTFSAVVTHRPLDVQMPHGNSAYVIGRDVRSSILGVWKGVKGVVPSGLSPPPSARSLAAQCTPAVRRALRALEGHMFVEGGSQLCVRVPAPIIVGGDDYCFPHEGFHGSIASGVAAQCATRCHNKLAGARVAARGGAEKLRQQRLNDLGCRTNPDTGELCMEVVHRSAAGVEGLTGTLFRDGLYPMQECHRALLAFSECTRGGERHICECMRALSNAAPKRACLAHIDVAPTTLCRLRDLDYCVETEFKYEYVRYCSPNMKEDMSCRELMWNPRMPCKEACVRKYRKYYEMWGCCAGVYNEFLKVTGQGASLDSVAASCKLPFAASCERERPDAAFTGRVVVNAEPAKFEAHKEPYTALAQEDVAEALGVSVSNIIGSHVSFVETTFALRRRAEALAVSGGGALDTNRSSVAVALLFLLVGDLPGDATKMRRDFASLVKVGFPLPRTSAQYSKWAHQELLSFTNLSVVSPRVLPASYYRENLSIGLHEVVEADYDLAPVDSTSALQPQLLVALLCLLHVVAVT